MKLRDFIDSINIAEDLSDEQLAQIGEQVHRGYLLDEATREERLKQDKEALKIARQVIEEKNFPWANAANVKYPLITSAAIQFAARAYPEIVQGNSIVKGKVNGRDDTGEKSEKAERVGSHMSWQLLEEMSEWEVELDKGLHILPVSGNYFKKTYRCNLRRRNVSELIQVDKLCVNANSASIEEARRVTHILDDIYRNDITERQRSGLWLDVEIPTSCDEHGQADEQAPYVFLEQHCWLDLDEDDYEEPYIVTIHRDSKKVVRIRARYDEDGVMVNQEQQVIRITPIEYFTHFGFIPDPGGGFYYIGFGQLLFALNEAINTILNQLLDAGALSNLQCGFVSDGLKLKGGEYSFRPGEWKRISGTMAGKVGDHIFPLPVREPSSVLFSLLGLLTEAGQKLASVSEVMQGETPGANVPATTVLALIDQGLKVFSGIYKRIFRSLKGEYKKLHRLNRLHMEEEQYFTLLDDPKAALRTDYEDESLDVIPIADPSATTDIQRAAKAQAVLAVSGRPGVDEHKITEMYLRAIKAEEAIIPKEKMETPQNPELIKIQAEMELKARELALKEATLQQEISKLESEAILNIAKAEAAELGPQLEYYKAFAAQLQERLGAYENPTGEGEDNGNGQGDVSGMVGAPGDAGSDGGVPEGDINDIDPAVIAALLGGGDGDAGGGEAGDPEGLEDADEYPVGGMMEEEA